MSRDSCYVVFRVYKDEPERNHVYGWAEHKSVIKAFSKQRDPKKYMIFKTSPDELARQYGEDELESDNRIDYFRVKSAKTGEEVEFFTTMIEMKEAETKIQRFFREFPDLVELASGRDTLVHMFIQLSNKYAEALDYIGFRPVAVEDLYPRDEWIANENSIEGLCTSLEDAYGDEIISEYVSGRKDKKPYGLSVLDDPYSKLIISLESFIMVLKEEL